jgi:hypothetical protein
MQESISHQSSANQYNIPLPMALNGILTPAEYAEQTQFGLLRGTFMEETAATAQSAMDNELYNPFFIN